MPRQTSKRKSECTAEEWAEHLEYVRVRRARMRDIANAKNRAYQSRPDVKARRKLIDSRPEALERRRQYNHRPEAKARAKELRLLKKADPVAWAERLSGQRKRRTGMTNDDVQRLLALQEGKCAVCWRPFEGKQIRADHCHDSKRPRGLLCHHCNIIEGMLRGMRLKPEEFAKRLSHYLAHPPVSKLAA